MIARRHTRRLAVALSACALAVGVGALAGPPAPAGAEGIVPIEGTWAATTSAGLPVYFTVSGGAVVNPIFKFKWGFCGTFENAVTSTNPIDAAGHWKFQDSRGPYIEGTVVAPDRIEGVVVAPDRELPGCPHTEATFVAAPGSPPPLPEPKVLVLRDLSGSRYVAEPGEIVIGVHPSFFFRELRWRDFGDKDATAHGRTVIKRGKRTWRPRATLVLSHLTAHGSGTEIYLKLHFELHGPIPPGFDRTSVETMR